MKLYLTKSILMKVILYTILLLLIILLIIYWSKIIGIVQPFIISIIAAYLLNPLVCKLEQKGVKRSVGILIIYIIFMIFAVFVCFYIIPVIVRDLGKLIGVLPQYNLKLRETIQSLQDKWTEANLPLGLKSVFDNNLNKVQGLITDYLESIISFIITVLSKFFSFVLIPILLYYFLKDYRLIVGKTQLLIPRRYRNQLVRIGLNIDDIFGNYIRSQLILSTIIAIMTSITLIILKIDFALIIGVLNGITNIIPYFGPIIGVIPAVVIAFLQSPSKALYTIIAMTIIQQIESDIIAPKITADSVGLHPISVILALIIGGELFGITGMILGVPVAAALKIVYRDIMKNLF